MRKSGLASLALRRGGKIPTNLVAGSSSISDGGNNNNEVLPGSGSETPPPLLLSPGGSGAETPPPLLLSPGGSSGEDPSFPYPRNGPYLYYLQQEKNKVDGMYKAKRMKVISKMMEFQRESDFWEYVAKGGDASEYVRAGDGMVWATMAAYSAATEREGEKETLEYWEKRCEYWRENANNWRNKANQA